MFAIVPAFQAAGMASMQVIPGELLGAILHGEQDFHFHRPIEPGMTLSTTADADRDAPALLRGHRGHPRPRPARPAASWSSSSTWTTFVRGAEGAEDVGEEAPGHAFDESLREREPDAEVAQTYDADQTFRYAEASGDPMQIHLDEEFAKAVGLPGIIIHGLCTMAFTSVAVIENASPRRPDAAQAARGPLRQHRPARADDHDPDLGRGRGRRRTAYAYETASDAGAVVIKDGLAEIA